MRSSTSLRLNTEPILYFQTISSPSLDNPYLLGRAIIISSKYLKTLGLTLEDIWMFLEPDCKIG